MLAEFVELLPSVKLWGKLPELTLQLNGATPPLAWMVWLYGNVTIPSTREPVMIDKLGGGGVDVLAPPPQFDSKTISIQTKLIRIGGRNIFSAISLRSR